MQIPLDFFIFTCQSRAVTFLQCLHYYYFNLTGENVTFLQRLSLILSPDSQPQFPHSIHAGLFCIAIPLPSPLNDRQQLRVGSTSFFRLRAPANWRELLRQLFHSFIWVCPLLFFLPARFQFAFYWRTGVVHLLSFSFGFSHKSIGNAF